MVKVKEAVNKEEDQSNKSNIENMKAKTRAKQTITISEDSSISSIYKIVVEAEDQGVLQSSVWRKLKLNSRDGSRLSIRLEKRSLIRREKIVENGRWTYKLYPLKIPLSMNSIVQSPCITCPLENRCSNEGEISPKYCNLLSNWVLEDIKNYDNNI
tara:strand:- start:745 stop:1212 length:468 start_codon:yes stop_codon:yes gene_type:complete